jgi:uncharacterized protein (TIGR03083 family)
MTATNKPIWELVTQERLALAQQLRQLTPAQWNQTSLVPEWPVRAVVAHIILESQYSFRRHAFAFIQAGFNINSFMHTAAITLGTQPSSALIEQLEQSAPLHNTPLGITPAEVLLDLIIHTQDILRPAGHPYQPNATTIQAALNGLSSRSFGLKVTGVSKRLKGLYIVATDLPWQFGHPSGQLLTGPALELLLGVTGRKEALRHLKGPGATMLARAR